MRASIKCMTGRAIGVGAVKQFAVLIDALRGSIFEDSGDFFLDMRLWQAHCVHTIDDLDLRNQ